MHPMNAGAWCTYCRQPIALGFAQPSPSGPMHPNCAQAAARPPGAMSVGKAIGIAAAVLGVVAVGVLSIATGSAPTPTPAAARVPAPAHHTTTEYLKDGQIWLAVVVPRGTTNAQLCELTRWLHDEKRLTTGFHFFDDRARVDEFILWTRTYPATKRSAALVKWDEQHHVGMGRSLARNTFEFTTEINPTKPMWKCDAQ